MRVSLCMIVKDEEANLPECLASAADLVDEVVVVDTGSADRTKEVAARFHARVFDFPWMDDFAAARNEGLKHATGDWAFWLDADDRLDGDNRARLKALIDGLRGENAAYVMKCLCLPDPETRTATVVDHVRLFRNDPALRWEYRVHEQILPSLRRGGGDVRWSDVVVRHVGYQDPALRRRKLERDGRILRLEHADKPDDPFILFNLGSIAHELGRCEEAVTFLGRSLALSNPKDSIVRKLYALLRRATAGWARTGWRWRRAARAGSFTPTTWSCCFRRASCCGRGATGRGPGAAGRSCFGLGRRTISPASTRACPATRLGTTWRNWSWRRVTCPGRRRTGGRRWRSRRRSCRRSWAWEKCICAGGVGTIWSVRRPRWRKEAWRSRATCCGARPSGSQGVPVGAPAVGGGDHQGAAGGGAAARLELRAPPGREGLVGGGAGAVRVAEAGPGRRGARNNLALLLRQQGRSLPP